MAKHVPLMAAAALLAFQTVYAQQKPAAKPAAKPATANNKPAGATKGAAATPAGTVLVEKVTAKPGEIVIPYEKYKLKNGLTLIIHEDHSDPLVHVDVTYHVGSAREEIGKSGFAHFFEHMMFQGSDNVKDEEHFEIVTGNGGDMNGTTNTDRTNYYETVPKNILETAIWLEADRMGFLLDAVTQQKFEIQRATVKNERGQRYDNVPYGLLNETASRTMYPYGHPYSWLTIGYVEDLDRVNVQDLKNFFLRWYGPNNATLTVGGDVSPQEVIKLAEKYFGSIPPGVPVADMGPMVPKLDKDRYATLEDKVMLPLLQISWPTVPARHKDEAPLDALAEIIGGGKNGILYQSLDKQQKTVQSFANHPCRELSGEFTVLGLVTPGKSLADLEKDLRAAVASFEQRGVTDEDLTRFKNSFEAQTIRSLGTVSGKVSQLASYQTFEGNPNLIKEELQARMKVTKEDIMRVYNQYIKGKPAVIVSVVPKGKTELAASQNTYVVDKSGYTPPKDEYSGLKYNKAKDNFDRSKHPALGPNPVVKVPDFYTRDLKNGIKLIGTQNVETPTTTVLISIRGGQRLLQGMTNKAGVASLMADMLEESTQKYTSEEVAGELEKLGGSISISASGESVVISISSLTKNLDRVLALAEERVLRPAFKEEEFNRLKSQTIQALANRDIEASTIADNVFNKLLFGAESPMAYPVSGSAKSVKNITLQDVKDFYAKAVTPVNANVVIVGDQPQAFYANKLGWIENWQGANTQIPAPTASAQAPGTKIYFVDKAGAPQSQIRVGYLSLPYDATGEYYRASIMNFMLGGAFNSRINLTLRESKGWTYGARSGFNGTKFAGPWEVSTGVKAAATDSAVAEIMSILKTYRDQAITEDELKFVKSSIGSSDALRFESGGQKAGFLNRMLIYGLPKDYIDQQNRILNAYTTADVKSFANKYLPVNNMYVVVVGDKETYLPKVKNLGYEVVELDRDGNVVAPPAPAQVEAPAAPAENTNDKKKKKRS